MVDAFLESSYQFRRFVKKLPKVLPKKPHRMESICDIRVARTAISNSIASFKSPSFLSTVNSMRNDLETCLAGNKGFSQKKVYSSLSEFFKHCKEASTELQVSISEACPLIVENSLHQLTRSDRNVQVLSQISKEIILPGIIERVSSVIRSLRSGHATVNIAFRLVDESRIEIDWDVASSIMDLKSCLREWAVSGSFKLPNGTHEYMPVQHRIFVEELDELVDHSFQHISEFQKDFDIDFISFIHETLRLVQSNQRIKYSEENIREWRQAQALIEKLRILCRARLGPAKRAGIFEVSFDCLKEDMASFLDSISSEISSQALRIFSSEANQLLSIEKQFTSLSLANTFESTRLLIVELKTMDDRFTEVHDLASFVKQIKEFLDSSQISHSFQHLESYYRTFTSVDNISEFHAKLSEHVAENMIKLRFIIASEIQAFLEVIHCSNSPCSLAME